MIDKFSVSENIDREYSAFQIRMIIPGTGDIQLPVAVNKIFNVYRIYNLTYPITKSLRFDYTATNEARVDEPQGLPITTALQRDSVRNAFFNHQINTDFKQTAGL